MHIHTCAETHMCAQRHMYSNMHEHMHKPIQTDIHLHVCVHTHIQALKGDRRDSNITRSPLGPREQTVVIHLLR